MRHLLHLFRSLFLFAAIAVPAAAQAVVYVKANATGANDGSSWANAFTDLRSGLANAGLGIQVWVAAGTYKPSTSGNRAETFAIPYHAQIYGGFDGTETSLDQRAGLFDATILSGDLSGDDGPGFTNISDNSFHVGGGGGSLDGFTIQGGNANEGNGWGDDGGGLVMGAFFVPATIANCTFRANYASRDGGGAHFIGSDSLVIRRCTFVGNHAANAGGGASTSGVDQGARIENCRFFANTTEGGGGGLYSSNWVTLVSCEFVGNSAHGSPGVGGGGLCAAAPTILYCTFWNNSAVGSLHGAGGVFVQGVELFMRGSILWGNTDGGEPSERDQIRVAFYPPWAFVDHCNIQAWTGWLPGRAMLYDDPAFLDRDGLDGVPGTLDDDLRLGLGSPCVDTGGVPFPSVPLPAFDLGGEPRTVDALFCESNGILDMGARERQSIDGSTSYCPQPPTSLGVPAEISAPCVVDVASGEVLFRVGPVQSSAGFLWCGSQTAAVPFGVDTRCTGGETHRLGNFTRSGNTLALELDLSDPSAAALAPGSTWHFQALFRDAGTLRLSDATTITFRE